MTAIARTPNAVIEQAIEAMVLNAHQERRMYDPSPEIDSALERLVKAATLTTGDAHSLIRGAISDLTAAHALNRSERDCERAIPPLVEPAWTVKQAAAELRDPLATLTNPIIHGRPRDEALETVRRVISECPREVLRSVSLAHELRTAKTTVLYELMDEAERP